jgi:selenocysteine lyase/cysteine desulfurase
VQALGCDFYAFSGHKVYGPTGIGVLYGKEEMLEMPPYQGGGDMISSVTFEKTTYNVVPYKFEAGTPDIAGAIGLGAALEYMSASWAWTKLRRTSTTCWPTRQKKSALCPACGSSEPRASVPACCRL